MQGGAFSPRGHLYIVNGSGINKDNFNRYKGGIWVFDVEETGPRLELGTLVNHSNQDNEPGTFTFEYHPGDTWQGEEPEGIDIWDLDQYIVFSLTPLSGQIHVIMIDNYPDVNNDDLYFKHYSVTRGEKCKI
jgi:hypothetical protein